MLFSIMTLSRLFCLSTQARGQGHLLIVVVNKTKIESLGCHLIMRSAAIWQKVSRILLEGQTTPDPCMPLYCLNLPRGAITAMRKKTSPRKRALKSLNPRRPRRYVCMTSSSRKQKTRALMDKHTQKKREKKKPSKIRPSANILATAPSSIKGASYTYTKHRGR